MSAEHERVKDPQGFVLRVDDAEHSELHRKVGELNDWSRKRPQ